MAKTKTAGKASSRRKPIRVAFIGAGARAISSHYPSIRDLPGATICAIAELDDERLTRAAEQFDVDALYDDYQRMIEAESPDVVYAIMPPIGSSTWPSPSWTWAPTW